MSRDSREDIDKRLKKKHINLVTKRVSFGLSIFYLLAVVVIVCIDAEEHLVEYSLDYLICCALIIASVRIIGNLYLD